MKRLIYFLVIIIFVSGCATREYEKRLGMSEVTRSAYDFDLSNSLSSGELKVLCRPPSIQYMLKSYIIEIDDFDPLVVSKHSNTTITLDEGSHIVKLHPVGPFGITSSRKFNLEANQLIVLEYTGPY